MCRSVLLGPFGKVTKAALQHRHDEQRQVGIDAGLVGGLCVGDDVAVAPSHDDSRSLAVARITSGPLKPHLVTPAVTPDVFEWADL